MIKLKEYQKVINKLTSLKRESFVEHDLLKTDRIHRFEESALIHKEDQIEKFFTQEDPFVEETRRFLYEEM